MNKTKSQTTIHWLPGGGNKTPGVKKPKYDEMCLIYADAGNGWKAMFAMFIPYHPDGSDMFIESNSKHAASVSWSDVIWYVPINDLIETLPD